jgi:hypothetical protein
LVGNSPVLRRGAVSPSESGDAQRAGHEVRQVVKKIEATWERIYVHKEVQGKVTLNVRKMPLEQVRIVMTRPPRARCPYPLYSTGRRAP